MNKTIWLTVLVLIIVVAAGTYAWRAQAPTHSTVVTSDVPTADAPLSSSTTTTAINQPVQQIPDSTPGVRADETTTNTITVTDTGFEPKSITVPVGTTVTFVNNGQAPHWPASDPHPTHTILPGLDPKHALQTGETFEFTFTKAGTWGFHDHLNSSHTGQVVVQ